jgi:hypothetical protein
MLLIPKDPDSRLNFLTNLGLGVAIVLGLIVAIAHGGERTVTIAALGASMGVGGVLGFLFGIPATSQSHISIGRVDTVTVGPGQGANVAPAPNPPAQNPPAAAAPPQNVPPADAPAPAAPNAAAAPAAAAPPQNVPPADAPAPAAPNAAAAPAAAAPLADAAALSNAASGTEQPTTASNLEQVADWVTKLLLGGGLTQLQNIPPKIWQWSNNVAVGITDGQVKGPALAAQQAFAAGVLVYGFILGFFAGFLITKLQLGKRVV